MFKSKLGLLTVALLLVLTSIILPNSTTQAASVFATVNAGDEPDAVAVNPETNMVYVVNQSSGNVTVIDGSNNNVVTTVPAGSEPNAVAVNSETNKVYVINEVSNNVTVIDAGNNHSTSTVTVGVGPSSLVVNPVTDKVYVANATSGTVTVINGSDNSTTPVTVGNLPRAVAVNSETNRVYVANRDSNNVTVIDGSNNSIIANVTVGDSPSVVAVNSVTNRVYVANERSDDVTVIDGTDNNIIDTVDVGDSPLDKPVAVAINPATNMVYVAISNITGTADTVAVINGGDNTTTTLTVGDNPNALAVDPVINQVYVANLFSDDVTVIDGDNSTTTLTVGDNPAAVAVNPLTHRVYVANRNTNNVTVIDGQDQSQGQSQADLSLTLFQDLNDRATGVKAEVSRVYDSATGQDLPLQIRDFQARLSYDGSCISILGFRGGDDFDITDPIIDDTGGVATFTGTAPTGVTAPADLARVLTRLQGSVSDPCPLTLQVTSLEDSSGNTIDVPANAAQDLRRGDARADGNVTIADAMFIAQYLAELRTACTDVVNTICMHSVNSASVMQDGTFDVKTIADASFIAQHLVGLRDELYALE